VGVPFTERPFLFTKEHVYLGDPGTEHYDIAKGLGLDTENYGEPSGGLDHSAYRPGIVDTQMNEVYAYPKTHPAQPHGIEHVLPLLSEKLGPLQPRANEWDDMFQDDTHNGLEPDNQVFTHSYTREGSTRLNSTFGDKMWHLSVSPPLPGQRCYFHPQLPAVASGGFAGMCQNCLDRYQQASIPQKDMRMASTQVRIIGGPYAGQVGVIPPFGMYRGITSVQLQDGTVVQCEARQVVPVHEAAWSLPEGYGVLGPQSPEEHEMTMHHPRNTETCPHCGWFGRMSMGGCPMCGYDFSSGTIAKTAVIGQPAYDRWQFSDDAQYGEWDAQAVIDWTRNAQ
jgi:hypothetical protein